MNLLVTNILLGIIIVILVNIYNVLLSTYKETYQTRLETQTIRHYVEKINKSD